MHILGYHIDHLDSCLLHRLQDLRTVRVERAERIVYALSRDGFTITLDDVLAVADGGSIGRAHIARILVTSGQVPSVADAFKSLLGRTAPYYVPKPVQPPETLIAWIAEAGGVAVLAHPGLSEVDDLIPSLVEAGLVGLEVYHPAHDARATVRYAALAESLGLIVTGGSDFHGLARTGDELGCMDVPPGVVDDLARARDRMALRR
jgi:predicted metal-dependent phosphoesterase TrpH